MLKAGLKSSVVVILFRRFTGLLPHVCRQPPYLLRLLLLLPRLSPRRKVTWRRFPQDESIPLHDSYSDEVDVVHAEQFES